MNRKPETRGQKPEAGTLKPEFRFLISGFRILASAFLISAFWFPTSGNAACFSPAGNASDIRYHDGLGNMMYCNGGAWIAMGPVGNTANGLVGWWKFDDGSGTTALDSSGSGNTGTLQNTPTWATGIDGGALTFNGTSQFVSATDTGHLVLSGSWSVSAWVNLAALPSTGNTETFVGKSDLYSDVNYAIGVTKGDWCAGGVSWVGFFSTNPGGNRASVCYQPAVAIATGAWYLVTVTWDGATLTLYVNGAFVAANAPGQLPASDSDQPLGIGSSFNNGTTSNYTSGTIDDVRIYNRVLSALDIRTLYGSTGGSSFSSSSGGATLLQHTSANGGATAATFPGTTTVGSLIVACGLSANAAITAMSASDTAGNSYSLAVGPTDLSGPGSQGCLYAINNAATASDAVTVTMTGGGGSTDDVELAEFSGINTASPLDITAANTGNSANPNSGAATTTNANDLIFGASQTAGSDTAGAGFTALDAPDNNQDEYENVSTTGSYSAAFTAGSQKWEAQMVAFKGFATGCGNPAGNAGDLLYNNAAHVPQFCNGSGWIPVGPAPGAGGGGCSSPAGAEGTFVYNADNHVLQYCDGANWVAAGDNVPIPGLVGWWNFDEGSGTTAADSSGNGNTGTLTNGPTWTTSGKDAGALTFNGTNQYVSVPDVASLELSGSFTVSAWVNLSALPVSPNNAIVLMKSQTGGSANYALYVKNTGGTYSFNADVDALSGGTSYVASYTYSINTGTWYYLTAAYDLSSKNLYLYLNGSLVATKNTGSDVPASGSGVNLALGRNSNSSSGFLAGTLDDVRVYNVLLSGQQIWRLYNGAP